MDEIYYKQKPDGVQLAENGVDNPNTKGKTAATPHSGSSGPPLSQIQKSITHLLVAAKQLLETLTQWSRHQATDAQVSDVYVRLGYEFNITCRTFNAINVDTSDLGNVPELLRHILEAILSQKASIESLDKHFLPIRDIIITLLHGIKRKQQKLRQKQTRNGISQIGEEAVPRGNSTSSVGSASTVLTSISNNGIPEKCRDRDTTDVRENSVRSRNENVGIPPRVSSAGSSSTPVCRAMPPKDQFQDCISSEQSPSSAMMQNMPVLPPYPGSTLLIIAAQNGHEAVVRLPLEEAARAGKEAVVELHMKKIQKSPSNLGLQHPLEKYPSSSIKEPDNGSGLQLDTSGRSIRTTKKSMFNEKKHIFAYDFLRELDDKVADRLLNTVAHELCHLACNMISNVRGGHGKVLKEWGKKCNQAFGHRGVIVTTEHSYVIDYKYVWECTNCRAKYKRHSKSVDPSRHRCGSCKSKLVQIKPARQNVSPSEYQRFLKRRLKGMKQDHPLSSHKDIIGLIGAAYKKEKAAKVAAAAAKCKGDLDSITGMFNRLDVQDREDSINGLSDFDSGFDSDSDSGSDSGSGSGSDSDSGSGSGSDLDLISESDLGFGF